MNEMHPEVRDLKYTAREKETHNEKQKFALWAAKRLDNLPAEEQEAEKLKRQEQKAYLKENFESA